jgi:hypothetical protein
MPNKHLSLLYSIGCRLLLLLLQNVFMFAVPPSVVPDYNDVVPPAQQMWLGRIDERVRVRGLCFGGVVVWRYKKCLVLQ